MSVVLGAVAKFASSGSACLLTCPGLFTSVWNIINIVENPGVLGDGDGIG